MSSVRATNDCAQELCDDAFFIAYLQDRQTRLREAAQQYADSADLKASLPVFTDVGHNLKSSAPLYGHHDLGQVAGDAEAIFLGDTSEQTVCNAVSSLLESIEATIELRKMAIGHAGSNDQKMPSRKPKGKVYPKIVLSMTNEWMAGYLMHHFEDMAIICWFKGQEGVAEWTAQHNADLVVLEHHPEHLPALDILEREKSNWMEKRIPVLVGFDAKTPARDLARAVSLGAKTSVLHQKAAKRIAQQIEGLLLETNQSVLIIDDDEPVRSILSQHFAANGIKTLLAKDGLEALKILETETPNLIVLDEMMPRMDGSAFLHTVRVTEGMADIPVIALTAKAGPGEAAEWFRRGANDFVAKPFDPEEIVIRAQKFLNAERVA